MIAMPSSKIELKVGDWVLGPRRRVGKIVRFLYASWTGKPSVEVKEDFISTTNQWYIEEVRRASSDEVRFR